MAPAAGAQSWLVDVKGRRFPGGAHSQQYWRNWTTRDDLSSLARWETLFGPQFGALFVFAYHVVGDRAPLPPEQLFLFRGETYGFVGIRLSDYTRYARPISTRWNSVAMRTRQFRALAAPLEFFFSTTEAPVAASPRWEGQSSCAWAGNFAGDEFGGGEFDGHDFSSHSDWPMDPSWSVSESMVKP